MVADSWAIGEKKRIWPNRRGRNVVSVKLGEARERRKLTLLSG